VTGIDSKGARAWHENACISGKHMRQYAGENEERTGAANAAATIKNVMKTGAIGVGQIQAGGRRAASRGINKTRAAAAATNGALRKIWEQTIRTGEQKNMAAAPTGDSHGKADKIIKLEKYAKR